jgi:hypothetical protein
MALDGINMGPNSEEPVAAYRPIIFLIATNTPTEDNPVAYCDIYFNGVFYKTIAKSQLVTINGNVVYMFDIQDAAQEFLGKFIGDNGGDNILTADPLVASCFCRFRGSSIDTEGFTIPETAIPVQGTANTNPTAGGGTQSNTFYVVNATLQHESNQRFIDHLFYWRAVGTWDNGTYPLTHRPAGYKLCPLDSDYFPILSILVPDSLVIHYRPKGSPDFTDGTSETICVPVGALNPTLPSANIGEFYNVGIPLSGTAPFSITGSVAPAWMTPPYIDGNTIVLQGTPTDGDAAVHVQISVTVSNCEDSAFSNFTKFIDVIACNAVTVPSFNMPNATSGVPYSFSVPLGGTGPFTPDGYSGPAWLSATIAGSNISFTGTPTDGDVDTGVSVSFDVCNCSGTRCTTYSGTIDVISSNNFIANAAYNFKFNDITGTNVPSPSIFPTTVNGQKKGHHTGLDGSSYTVDITGTIVTNTKMTVYVNGSPVDCWQIGSTIGTVLTNATHGFTVTAAEEDFVIFAIEQGNC